MLYTNYLFPFPNNRPQQIFLQSIQVAAPLKKDTNFAIQSIRLKEKKSMSESLWQIRRPDQNAFF